MISTYFAITLPAVLLAVLITLSIGRFAIKKKLVLGFKFIAFIVSWIWSVVIAYNLKVPMIEIKVIAAFLITIFCTSAILYLANKK
jgi:hypothetical protein